MKDVQANLAQWRRTLVVGAPLRVDEGELRQLETGELVLSLSPSHLPGMRDEDVPAILCKHMPDTGFGRQVPHARGIPSP